MNEQDLDKILDKHIQNHEEEFNQAAAHFCMSVEQLKENLKAMARAFGVIVDNAMKLWDGIKERVIDCYLDLVRIEKESRKKRQLYKLNFDRPKIKSQVIDRKPQHLIKKIIY
ncbi:hypothetical protein Q8G28_17735 [Lysinibacillus capsici]|uniref:hypothetical protein n=1 Tax=Lysinibacillus capsici TaxID=2115968 RepID=UPI0027306A9E|nr:hypothetical protein [Lysinibacillus capsici]MDP1395269.1 hypothetical protein [Lysinibacillus capsici]MDP1415734.1 hypothetical protein [Lysinibacillus capsici]MDP1431586.1 hypothetical protein [Lysinibacillus capsici]